MRYPSSSIDYFGLVGPMTLAWQTTFHDAIEGVKPSIVIVWHKGWLTTNTDQWTELHGRLSDPACAQERILVVLFGDSPDDLGENDDGQPATCLIKALSHDVSALGRQASPGCRWATLARPASFKYAVVDWSKSDDSALTRLCGTCAVIARYWDKSRPEGAWPMPTLSEFFRFLDDPDTFRNRRVHDKPEQAIDALRVLKWLAAKAEISEGLRLNVLLVENNTSTLHTQNRSVAEALHKLDEQSSGPLEFLRNASIYLVDKEYEGLRDEKARWVVSSRIWDPKKGVITAVEGRVPWEEIDLVLQDVVLYDNDESPTGLDLTPYYLEACPQALVFLLTVLDVESLASSQSLDWRFADCVIPKAALATIWYEYRRCFRMRFGKMFWNDAVNRLWGGEQTAEKQDRYFGDPQSFRSLLGSLRRWQVEPSILGHGQGVPEMIDHAERHIGALWRLTDDVLSTLEEHAGAREPLLSLPNRMIFALAIWLHDIGHRGNEFTSDPMEVRRTHGGISEYLILRNADAYGIGWLGQTFCSMNCAVVDASVTTGANPRLANRNVVHGCDGQESNPCPLRKVGLLCRHHQSNAPLARDSVVSEAEFSPYVRFRSDSNSSQEDLMAWYRNQTPEQLGGNWDVRNLSDFQVGNMDEFKILAGLLRMLDGLQIHRVRVGSAASIKSFEEFLRVRRDWCDLSVDFGVEDEDDPVMIEYRDKVQSQFKHWWRQLAVHSVDVSWEWGNDSESTDSDQPAGTLCIKFSLDDSALRALDKNGVDLIRKDHPFNEKDPLQVEIHDGAMKLVSNPDLQAIGLWAAHVASEMIWREHESQKGMNAGKDTKPAYLGILPKGSSLKIVVEGTNMQRLPSGPLKLFEYQCTSLRRARKRDDATPELEPQ